MEVFCDTCNNKFNKPFSHVKRVKNNYCSVYCHNIDQEQKITKLCKFCATEFSVRKCEAKKFVTCSSKECRYQNKIGKNNPNYVDGKSKERSRRPMSTLKYKQWRKEVLKRDKYTCLFCGITLSKGLHVDHIKPWAFFPSSRYNVSNGRTLCKECHIKTYKDTSLWKDLLVPHILVDLDCTLSYFSGWKKATDIGPPIVPMVNRVKKWIAEGKKVIIFTARVSEHYPGGILSPKELFTIEEAIKQWCKVNIGKRLLVTNIKTFFAEAIWDDRGVKIEANTGKIIGGRKISELPSPIEYLNAKTEAPKV